MATKIFSNFLNYEIKLLQLIENYFYFSFFKIEFTKLIALFFMNGVKNVFIAKILENSNFSFAQKLNLNFSFSEPIFKYSVIEQSDLKTTLLRFANKLKSNKVNSDNFFWRFCILNNLI